MLFTDSLEDFDNQGFLRKYYLYIYPSICSLIFFVEKFVRKVKEIEFKMIHRCCQKIFVKETRLDITTSKVKMNHRIITK